VWLAASILAVYFPVLNETPVKAAIVIPGLLFFPGYYLIAALFPKNTDIEFIERIALSLGLSIAVVPLIAFGLNFTPFGIRLDPIMTALTFFTLVMILIAQYRRSLLPSDERCQVPFSDIAGTLRNAILSKGGGRLDRFLTVVITLAILGGVLLTISMIVIPREGERFTEFFILGEKQKAADYPVWVRAGQQYPLFIGIGNHEHKNVTYTIETWKLRMEFDNMTNSSRIGMMELNSRLTRTLAHNETQIMPYNLSLDKNGYNRVEFLLFDNDVPGSEITGSDRMNASYKDLHLWVSILPR
jgi:uncharacterized membrane protein